MSFHAAVVKLDGYIVATVLIITNIILHTAHLGHRVDAIFSTIHKILVQDHVAELRDEV